jgi:hypothetical protein
MIIPYKPKLILALLFAVLVITAFSFFFFRGVDNIVNDDLYVYGLIFSYNWADPYWINSNLFFYCQTLALILFGNSIAFFFSYFRNRTTFSITISSLLLFVGSGFSLFSTYFLHNVDSIINSDLYSYGLTFNVGWFATYSLYYRIMLLLATTAGFVAIVSAIVAYNSAKRVRIIPAKMLDSTLIAVGTVALAFSIIYSSSIIALIGLGLLFWGVTFSYIGNGAYVKKILLDTTASSELEILNHMLQKLEFVGNPVYLPPQYFRKKDVYKAYIPKNKLLGLPVPNHTFEQEPDLLVDFMENPTAVLVRPPGAELAQLFEKTLKKDFGDVNLQYLQRNLPELLNEELEITQSFSMEIENERIRVRIEDSIYRLPNIDADQSSSYSSFDSLISSAIACTIAKVSGAPVSRLSYKTGVEDRSVIVEYLILQNR